MDEIVEEKGAVSRQPLFWYIYSMQVLPAISLRPFIRHYLFIENPVRTPIRFFSDGNPGIVFCDGEMILDGEYLPSSFAYGQISGFKDLYYAGSLLIVVFRPFGLHALTGIPATVLKDRVIDLSLIFRQPPGRETADEFFSGLQQAPCSLTQACINFIDQQKGLVSLAQLQDFSGYQERQLERRFKVSVGISPAKYCNIVRTHTFLKSLRKDAAITPLVFENGYFDQSHAIKDFKKLTGLTPRHYLHHNYPLACNFLSRFFTI